VLVVLQVSLKIEGPSLNRLEAVIIFVAFPIGFAVGVGLLLLRQWVMGALFLGATIGLLKLCLVISSKIHVG
jgi:hypothetical protein